MFNCKSLSVSQDSRDINHFCQQEKSNDHVILLSLGKDVLEREICVDGGGVLSNYRLQENSSRL